MRTERAQPAHGRRGHRDARRHRRVGGAVAGQAPVGGQLLGCGSDLRAAVQWPDDMEFVSDSAAALRTQPSWRRFPRFEVATSSCLSESITCLGAGRYCCDLR